MVKVKGSAPSLLTQSLTMSPGWCSAGQDKTGVSHPAPWSAQDCYVTSSWEKSGASDPILVWLQSVLSAGIGSFNFLVLLVFSFSIFSHSPRVWVQGSRDLSSKARRCELFKHLLAAVLESRWGPLLIFWQLLRPLNLEIKWADATFHKFLQLFKFFFFSIEKGLGCSFGIFSQKETTERNL